jgi:hypothetical protein
MSPPRPKKEYEEKPADEDGTPFQRFERAMKKVMAVPKAELEQRERERKARNSSPT